MPTTQVLQQRQIEDGFWAELHFVSGWDGWRWRWRGFPGFCSPLIIQFINVWKVEPDLHFGNGAFCVSLLRGWSREVQGPGTG